MRNFKVSKNVGLLRCLGAVALIAWTVAATAARPVAVVTPLETQNYSLGNQAGTAHAYIEDALVNSGTASVVDRQRMDAMVEELGFGSYSGLADPGKAARFGKMLGAHFLVQGTLMDLREENREFSGYGVNTRNRVTSAAVRVRIMALETSEIVFSRIFQWQQDRDPDRQRRSDRRRRAGRSRARCAAEAGRGCGLSQRIPALHAAGRAARNHRFGFVH